MVTRGLVAVYGKRGVTYRFTCLSRDSYMGWGTTGTFHRGNLPHLILHRGRRHDHEQDHVDDGDDDDDVNKWPRSAAVFFLKRSEFVLCQQAMTPLRKMCTLSTFVS